MSLRLIEDNEAAENLDGHPNTAPRYARIKTVERLYGLRRGSIYNLLRAGKIRGCALRITSRRSRTRLIDLRSVEELIEREMEAQNRKQAKKGDGPPRSQPAGSKQRFGMKVMSEVTPGIN